jgi:hypothetical protein
MSKQSNVGDDVIFHVSGLVSYQVQHHWIKEKLSCAM